MLRFGQHGLRLRLHSRGQGGAQAGHFLQGLLGRGPSFLPGPHQFGGLAAHFLVQADAFLFQALAALLHGMAGFFLLRPQDEQFFLAPGGQIVEPPQQGRGVLAILQQIVFGPVHNGFGQAVLPRHIQSLAGPYLAVGQLEQRFFCGRIKQHGRRPGSLAGQGVGLERRKMRGCQYKGMFVQQFVKDRSRR